MVWTASRRLLRAAISTLYPMASATRAIRSRVAEETRWLPDSARDTVDSATPAAAAISAMVAGPSVGLSLVPVGLFDRPRFGDIADVWRFLDASSILNTLHKYPLCVY